MTRLILTFFFMSLCYTVTAQTISGVVNDENQTPISYATVVLCNVADTTQIDYTITDTKGRFSFKSTANKEHLLHIAFVGYKSIYLPAGNNMTIVLQQDVLEIDAVVVKGSRPISKMTASGVQTTVANTVLSDMGSGNEVLKRIPMVSGDDGLFEVFGRGEATIYINNREVRDPSELDNLNSNDIQNIEVISNPGARYDASVKAVIKITTTKKQGDGFSFNVRSSFYTWENQDYIEQINTNYRKGGLDIFLNAYYTNLTSFQRGNISQTVSIDTLWRQQNITDGLFKSNRLSGTIGANYEINKNHYLGFRYDIKTSPNNNVDVVDVTSDVYADEKLFDKSQNIETKNDNEKIGSQANLYYAGKIEKLSIDFNADYVYSGIESNILNEEISQKYGDRELHSSNNIDNQLFAAKLQLSYPIWTGELSIGSEYVNIARLDEYYNSDLIEFSSKVDIAEQNLAFFTQYQLETKIGNFAAGVRYEDAKSDYFVDNVKAEDKSRVYRQWFPNFSYSNRFGKVALQLSYNSKVTRPSYSQLSNNLLYVNRFTIQTGNSFLRPTINHDVSLMGVWKFLQAQVSYTHQKDAIVMWVDRYKNDPKISVVNYKNIDDLPKLSVFVAASHKFGVWKPQLSVGMQKQWLDLAKYGVDEKLNSPIFTAALDNIFEFKNGFIINLDGTYTSTGNYSTSYSFKDSFILDFGVSKKFFDNALQVSLTASDILNQKIQAFQVYSPYMDMKNLFRRDTREVALTIRYYFNPARSKYKGSGAGGAAKNRL